VTEDDSYSAVADAQLDEIEAGVDPDLYNAILETCHLIFALPDVAQSRSSAIQTDQGIRFRIPVRGHWPYKVFWSRPEDAPRVEAVFPHP
jgi:hypothetical protein